MSPFLSEGQQLISFWGPMHDQPKRASSKLWQAGLSPSPSREWTLPCVFFFLGGENPGDCCEGLLLSDVDGFLQRWEVDDMERPAREYVLQEKKWITNNLMGHLKLSCLFWAFERSIGDWKEGNWMVVKVAIDCPSQSSKWHLKTVLKIEKWSTFSGQLAICDNKWDWGDSHLWWKTGPSLINLVFQV